MKSEFLLAITQLSAEKRLPKEVVLSAVESALVSAYRKDNFAPNQNIEVKINPNTGAVEVWAEKIAVEKPTDERCEISLEEARRINPDVQLDETVIVEATPPNAGRIAAQTAKQVILQRLHEAEHSAIFEEYAGKEGDIVNGVVQRVEPRQVLVDLGRVETILPSAEQMPNERYRVGQRLKVLLLEVVRTNKGPRVIVSRSHPDLVRRLFEMEVPEVFNGAVEIKSVAREAGYRSKVAVAARQEGIDPVGCCVGLRGIRIQNIVNELSGEKIDVVLWNPNVATFIASALSPAQILQVELNEEEGVATVVVPDRQLSLAIGKEGQNARLSAKLAGWRIDIKSASVFEEERAVLAREGAEQEVTEEEAEEEPELQPEAVTEAALEAEEEEETVTEAVPVDMPVDLEVLEPEAVDEAEEEPVAEEIEEFVQPVSFEMPAFPETSELRFAEDIAGFGPKASKKKKKKKGGQGKDLDDEGVRLRRARRQEVSSGDEDEY
ncbi:MAG TPA: transcription termination/antitermination protein NusA [Dehalococcoidia bacterium]|nr:transcription termination/antitermination protein NusA [Dehalococcoidia bacterium]